MTPEREAKDNGESGEKQTKGRKRKRFATEDDRLRTDIDSAKLKSKAGSDPPPTKERKVTGGLLLFKGENNPLSNLYILEKPIRYHGLDFMSSEHAYQWSKAVVHKQFQIANQILKVSSRQAMHLGKSIKTSEKWKENKVKLMTKLVLMKCEVSRSYKDYLLSTTNSILVENTKHEFWGEGKAKTGRNMLGVIHTEVRENIFQKLKVSNK